MLNRPELLVPVGEKESFYAAIENGADAVYVGGKQFSARQFAENLDLDELREIVEYAKPRNIKVYITVNTLIKNDEIDDFVLYIHNLCYIGVDAIIVQDFGVLGLVREYFPNMDVHASTQMNAHSSYDVRFLQRNNCKRVILARELSLQDIKIIKDKSDVEIESFVHGALCVSYSGQCLMSSMIGGRSGNRGRCAQPCRLPYQLYKGDELVQIEGGEYLMSPKDIETLSYIPDFIEAGINSFKIEGRMKGPEYIASVSRIYRKYINMAIDNKDYKVSQEDRDELLTIFNRGGFSQGYFYDKAGKSMMEIKSPRNIGLLIGEVISYNQGGNAVIKLNKDVNPGDGIGIITKEGKNVGTGISKRLEAGEILSIKINGNISQGDKVYLSRNHQLTKNLSNSYANNNRKSRVDLKLIAKTGENMLLELKHEKNITVKVQGNIVQKARNAAISKDKLINQISKFGNTPFEVGHIEIEADDDIFVPISTINRLRRKGSEKLISKILNTNQYDGEGYERYISDKKVERYSDISDQKSFTASVKTLEQLRQCLNYVNDIYLELEGQDIESIKEAVQLCYDSGVKLYIALPHIQRENDYKAYNDIMTHIENTNIDGYLIRTYGQYEKLTDSTKEKIIDYTLNIVNDYSVRHWERLGADTVTISPELKESEIRKIEGKCLEIIVYGHIPIMITEQCLVGRYGKCKASKETNQYTIIDRKNEKYRLITNCKTCRMQILSSKPIGLANRINKVKTLPISKMRLTFTTESPKEIRDIIRLYTDELSGYSIDYNDRYFTQGVE